MNRQGVTLPRFPLEEAPPPVLIRRTRLPAFVVLEGTFAPRGLYSSERELRANLRAGRQWPDPFSGTWELDMIEVEDEQEGLAVWRSVFPRALPPVTGRR